MRVKCRSVSALRPAAPVSLTLPLVRLGALPVVRVRTRFGRVLGWQTELGRSPDCFLAPHLTKGEQTVRTSGKLEWLQ